MTITCYLPHLALCTHQYIAASLFLSADSGSFLPWTGQIHPPFAIVCKSKLTKSYIPLIYPHLPLKLVYWYVVIIACKLLPGAKDECQVEIKADELLLKV